MRAHQKLSDALNVPPESELATSAEFVDIVHSHVVALLPKIRAYTELPPVRRATLSRNMERITVYESALIYVDWRISRQLGQAPAAVKSIECRPYGPVKYAPPTGGSLDAIYFPAFVADFLQGTFEAIVDASIQQMEAFGELRWRRQVRGRVHGR